MIRAVYHAGGCCGIRNIAGFNYRYRHCTPEKLREDATRIAGILHGWSSRRLFEAVVNHTQARGGATKLLEHLGFTLVTKFKNPSGQTCYVYHYTTAAHSTKTQVIGKAPLNAKKSMPLREMYEIIQETDWSKFYE